ncbi:hypothetical protein IQ06DRAFT_291234 [Phaeosphaeriaceae sp. SRC1lsM3a]|nr:hypothetical protein IQ06DRAFT_291234 [Stagonospora sp. SRC1lsM3a]
MGSRCLGELLLRPSSLARSPLYQTRRIAPSWTTQRSISHTPNKPAAQPQRKDDDYNVTSEQSNQPQREPRSPAIPIRRTTTTREDTSSAIDSLFTSTPREPRSPPTTYAPRNSGSSSSDEVRAAHNAHVFGSGFMNNPNSSFRKGSRRAPTLNFGEMMDSDNGFVNPKLSNKPSESASLATQQEETFANYPRLNPSYGRTVELDVSRGRDLVRGIGMLGSLMARNKVRRDMMTQRFHERPGLKRKRQASERWRARFKQGFVHVTRRVSELTGKGW